MTASSSEFRGDGILAYFGYPRAHEDDAERAVRAALDIAAAVAQLETPAQEPLAVRIGIATGLVVIGDLSGEGALREHVVVGDTPNLAAGFRRWPSRGRSSSPAPRAGCSATCSICATSACTRLRVSPSRWRRGRSRASRLPRAVSRRSAAPV